MIGAYRAWKRVGIDWMDSHRYLSLCLAWDGGIYVRGLHIRA